jgi:hypothetical protein
MPGVPGCQQTSRLREGVEPWYSFFTYSTVNSLTLSPKLT